MKKNSWFFLLMILLLIGISTCSKEEPIPILGDQKIGMAFFLTTEDVHSITCASARTGGYIIDNVGGSGVFTAQGVCWSTTPNPTTADNKTLYKLHPAPKHFQSTITGLNSDTTYYVRAYAMNSAGITYYGNELHFSTNISLPVPVGSVSDVDCNIYKTVQIGTQTWMAEDLKTTRYNDGSQIPNVVDNWVALKTGAYRWYNNDAATSNLYGGLYNWYTVNTRKLCPAGWHVPSDDEWKQLEMTLGMTQAEANSYGETYGIEDRGTDQGIQMKAISGWDEWEGINGNGTNTSGFSAMPGGEVGWYGEYVGVGHYVSWWASEVEGAGRLVDSFDPGVIRGVFPAHCGFHVRCLKD